MKSKKGITLVALVITIIVLLILAGVSISLVVGDNGIMTRAKDAGTKTNESDAVETFKLAIASITSEYYAKMYESDGPSEGVAKYAASSVDSTTVLGKELASLGYELADSSTLDTAEGTGKSISLKKQGADNKTAITVKYDVTKSGNISNITK